MKQGKSKKQSFSFGKRMASFRHAFNGIRFAISSEHNMWLHLFAAIIGIISGFFFKLTSNEWIAIVFAIGFVFAAELFNTAIESITDFISPNPHVDIGKIKDISAGAVLVAAISAVIIAVLVFLPHIKLL